MNNGICLNPDIKWHGWPKVARKDYVKVGFDVEDGYAVVRIQVRAKKMTRKRYIKLMMAHGLPARLARGFAEVSRELNGGYKRGYELSMEFLDKCIEEANKNGRADQDD